MAGFVISSGYTMLEVAKGLGLEGNKLAIVDTLSQQCPFIEEGYWMEANDYNSHHFETVLSEPTGSDSRANIGTAWENPTTNPTTEKIQGLEVYSKIDTRILRRQRDPEGFMSARGIITVRGMKKTFHDRVLYGNNSTHPDRINGLLTSYNSLAPTVNVTSNAGAIGSSQSSTWTIKWGPDGAYFVYPRSGKNFINEDRIGEIVVYDSDSNPYKAMVTSYGIHFGLVRADPRNIQRFCNIDATAVWSYATQINVLSLFPEADSLADKVMYVPRRVWQKMNTEAAAKTNAVYHIENVWGSPCVVFWGVPVRLCERLTSTEEVAT